MGCCRSIYNKLYKSTGEVLQAARSQHWPAALVVGIHYLGTQKVRVIFPASAKQPLKMFLQVHDLTLDIPGTQHLALVLVFVFILLWYTSERAGLLALSPQLIVTPTDNQWFQKA